MDIPLTVLTKDKCLEFDWKKKSIFTDMRAFTKNKTWRPIRYSNLNFGPFVYPIKWPTIHKHIRLVHFHYIHLHFIRPTNSFMVTPWPRKPKIHSQSHCRAPLWSYTIVTQSHFTIAMCLIWPTATVDVCRSSDGRIQRQRTVKSVATSESWRQLCPSLLKITAATGDADVIIIHRC
jgi:hypothetical protein